MKSALAVLSAVLVVGCAHQEPAPPPQHPTVIQAFSPKLQRVTRKETLYDRPLTLGGAAYNQDGYVHVIGFDYLGGGLSPAQSSAKSWIVGATSRRGAIERAVSVALDTHAKPAEPSGGNAGDGYSMYELSRWGRYCDSGKGMDEADWQFVDRAGKVNVPSILGQCRAPDYDYQQYLASWTRFCMSEGVTTRDRQIVGASVHPKSLPGCPPLAQWTRR